MRVITAKNVTHALEHGLSLLGSEGRIESTRVGPALVYPGPVTTVYLNPKERVLLCPARDANPFFHFFESLWMLAGKADGRFLDRFVSDFTERYSDDGITLHGAYGWRWRHQWGDQLTGIIDTLREDPASRRAVLQIWSADIDLAVASKDLPCNTIVFFAIEVDRETGESLLNMTVCNRSNDIIWGAYGANAVHFSMLQEYVACSLGVSVGRYWQISNNWHAYVETMNILEEKLHQAEDYQFADPYNDWVSEPIAPYGIMSEPREIWDQDLSMLIEKGPIVGFRDPFFRRVATPMWHAWSAWKDKSAPRDERVSTAQEILSQCAAQDWRIAGHQWLERRRK